MYDFVKLKNGVEIPDHDLAYDANDIRQAFIHCPGPFMGLILLAEQDNDETLIRRFIPDEVALRQFSIGYQFHIGHVPDQGRILDKRIARTALAQNMVVVVTRDLDYLEGYLQEPLQTQRHLLEEATSRRQY